MSNEPVISPNFFYWLQVIDVTRGILGILFILLFILTCCLWLFFGYAWLASTDDEFPDEDKRKVKILLKVVTTITLIDFAFLAFIPSKQTLIEMEVAKHVTAKNLQEAKKEFIRFVKDIAKAIKQADGG